MAVTVDEAGFKGPIALLLDLITQQQIDLWTVSISNLIRDYLQKVQEIAQLDLEDASEFFMVASTLIGMKSHRLLPPGESDDEEEDELASERELLLLRLFEFKVFKDASDAIASRVHHSAMRVARRGTYPIELMNSLPDPLGDVEPSRLADLMKDLLSAQPRSIVDDSYLFTRRVDVELLRRRTIDELERVHSLDFTELVDWSSSRLEVCVAFLLMLEGFRLGILDLRQPELLGNLQVVWLGWISEQTKAELEALLQALS